MDVGSALALSQTCRGMRACVSSTIVRTHISNGACLLYDRTSMATFRMLSVHPTYSKEVKAIRLLFAGFWRINETTGGVN
jgi:hypothetical protein